MPITVQYNGEFIITQLTGVITLPELLEHSGELAVLEASFPVTPHRLTDLSGGTLAEIAFPEMNVFAAKRRRAPLKNLVKSALVAGNAVQFGFARMFQTLNDHPQIRIEIFLNEETALAWLRE